MPSAFELINKRTIRAPINELDKSTVISIYPKAITERKRTLSPGTFKLEAGSAAKPSFLVIGPSSWWRDMGENEPLLEISQGSIVVADSIVRDWSNGVVGCDMDSCMPGLFFLPGEWNLEKLLKEKKPHLDRAVEKQKNWFQAILQMADVYWARSNGNPLVISDDMRIAAKELNQTDRDWYKGVTYSEVVTCRACGNVNKAGFPVCSNCKAISDPELAAKLNIKFAS